MSDGGLFPEDGLRVVEAAEPGEKLTAGERLRRRQQARMGTGLHPLSINGMVVRLHPDAPRDATRDDGGDYPRCGSCIHRQTVGGHARSFPKCLLGYSERDLTPEEIAQNQGTIYRHATKEIDMGPRYSMSDASDCRSWFPACVDYQPKD